MGKYLSPPALHNGILSRCQVEVVGQLRWGENPWTPSDWRCPCTKQVSKLQFSLVEMRVQVSGPHTDNWSAHNPPHLCEQLQKALPLVLCSSSAHLFVFFHQSSVGWWPQVWLVASGVPGCPTWYLPPHVGSKQSPRPGGHQAGKLSRVGNAAQLMRCRCSPGSHMLIMWIRCCCYTWAVL